jgi:hypothetical protein
MTSCRADDALSDARLRRVRSAQDADQRGREHIVLAGSQNIYINAARGAVSAATDRELSTL